jgi:hypothetical protein
VRCQAGSIRLLRPTALEGEADSRGRARQPASSRASPRARRARYYTNVAASMDDDNLFTMARHAQPAAAHTQLARTHASAHGARHKHAAPRFGRHRLLPDLADGLGRLESVQHTPPPGRQAVCAARARSTQPCTHLGGARSSDGQTRLNARACRAVRSRAFVCSHTHTHTHTHTHMHRTHTHTHTHNTHARTHTHTCAQVCMEM